VYREYDTIAVPFEYPINFKSSSYDSTLKVQYKIIDESNNVVLADTANDTSNLLCYNGLWKNIVYIPHDEFKNYGIFKIQLRFYISETDYSEWSSICYTKCIHAPSVNILELPTEGTSYTIPYESPTFTGTYESSDEELLQYRFKLFKTVNNAQIVGDTGWKKYINGQPNIGNFSVLLDDFTNYRLEYTIQTVNGYSVTKTRTFLTAFYQILDDMNLSIATDVNENAGSIDIKIQSTNNQVYAGNIILRRASEKTNFTNWEDLKYLHVLNEIPNIVYSDYTVEHGVKYQYGIQIVNIEDDIE
jgi:hypothetical protein